MGRSGDGSPPDAGGRGERGMAGLRRVAVSLVSGRLVGLAGRGDWGCR